MGQIVPPVPPELINTPRRRVRPVPVPFLAPGAYAAIDSFGSTVVWSSKPVDYETAIWGPPLSGSIKQTYFWRCGYCSNEWSDDSISICPTCGGPRRFEEYTQ